MGDQIIGSFRFQQAESSPARLDKQMAARRVRMPIWPYQTLEGVGGWVRKNQESFVVNRSFRSLPLIHPFLLDVSIPFLSSVITHSLYHQHVSFIRTFLLFPYCSFYICLLAFTLDPTYPLLYVYKDTV